jgi:hypothetical protein
MVATTECVVHVTEQGNYLSLLPVDHVTEHGLVPRAIVGEVVGDPGSGGSLTLETFVGNRAFHQFLHEVVERHAPTTLGFAEDARQQRDGCIYLIDQRTPTPGGRVPPEDVIGGFEVRDGHVVAHSYQPIPSHQLMTERGLFNLGDELQARLVFELEQLRVD